MLQALSRSDSGAYFYVNTSPPIVRGGTIESMSLSLRHCEEGRTAAIYLKE